MMYPKNKEESGKFAAGVIKSLHSPKTRERILNQLGNNEVPIPARLAGITSQVITALLQKVKAQAGRKPHIKLIVGAIKLCIEELARMANTMGINVSQQDKQQAAGIAGDMIDGAQRQQGQPQQMQQQQPQGLLGGVMNGQ